MLRNGTLAQDCVPSNFPFHYIEEPLGVKIFIVGLQVAIGIIGTIGNAAVCVTIIRRPAVLTAMSHYLLSLAFADIGVLIFNLPIGILKEQAPFRWFLGRFFCLYIAPATETFFGASIWSITVIAVERYANIAGRKLRIGRKQSSIGTWLIIAMVWVISFAVTAVPIYVFQKYDSCYSACYAEWSATFEQIYIFTLTFLLYFLPLGIIAFSYIQVGRTVSERVKLLQEEATEGSITTNSGSRTRPGGGLRAMLRQNKKTHRILKPLVILFAVSMLPSTVLRVVLLFWDELPIQNYFKIILTIMVVFTAVNSAVDPFIYCVVSKTFRQEVKSLFIHRCAHKCRGTERKRASKPNTSGTSSEYQQGSLTSKFFLRSRKNRNSKETCHTTTDV